MLSPNKRPVSTWCYTVMRNPLKLWWRKLWVFPCSPLVFYNKTTTIVCSDAKEKIIKSFVKKWHIKIGVTVKANFTSLKYLLTSIFHFISICSFRMFVMDLKISSKLGINPLRKFILPMKGWTSFLSLGESFFSMA